MKSRKYAGPKLSLACLPAALLLAGVVQAQTLSTVAGTGVQGQGTATVANASAQFTGVTSILRTPWAGFFTTEFGSSRIRWIGDNGTTATTAGNGAGFSGDGGPFGQARFNGPNAIILAPDNSLVIFDSSNNRLRSVRNNIVGTLAGNGNAASSGDGGAATSASLNFPTGGVFGPRGELYVVEGNGHRIRRIDASGITTIAGTGVAGYSGNQGPAVNAQINNPRAIAISRDGNVLYFTEQNRVRAINLSSGTIHLLAGDGNPGVGGDGGWSTMASLGGAWTAANGTLQQVGALGGIAVLSDGRVLVSDRANHKIRQISADFKISTYAGNGQAGHTANAAFNGANGFYGGGTLAQTRFNQPTALHVDGDDNVYFSDFFNFAVRKFESPPNQFDTPLTADGGINWQRTVYPMTKERGCEVVDMDDGPNGSMSITFVGPVATCTAPPQWAGALLVTDAGPAELPGFAYRVSTLASTSVNNGTNRFVVQGRWAGYEELIREGSVVLGDAENAAIESSMAAFAASPESQHQFNNAPVRLADGGASPYNAFTRNLVANTQPSERSREWNNFAAETFNVAGTSLPPSSFVAWDKGAVQMPQAGQIASRGPSASPAYFDNSDSNSSAAFERALRQSEQKDDMLAWDPINMDFITPSIGGISFFHNSTDGGGIQFTNFVIGASHLKLTSIPMSESEQKATKEVKERGMQSPISGSQYNYGIVNGGLTITEGKFSIKNFASSMAFGFGNAPAGRRDCKTATLPRAGSITLFGPDGAPLNTMSSRAEKVHACYTTKNAVKNRWIGNATARGVFGHEIEGAFEKQWVAAVGKIPAFGTWTAGVWVGSTASGALKYTYGTQQRGVYTSTLNAPLVVNSDTGWQLAGQPPTFQLSPSVKINVYAQPFFMVSLGKVKDLGESQKGLMYKGKVVPFVNAKWTKWLGGASVVLKNGALRFNVSAHNEAAITATDSMAGGSARVTLDRCSSLRARLDLFKGVLPDTQAQFGSSVGPWCLAPIVLINSAAKAVKSSTGNAISYGPIIAINPHP